MQQPSILFIPGMMLDQRLFESQMRALSPTHHLMVADTTGANSIEAMAQQALAQAPERFALVGLSMGGIIALEIYRQAGERVTHLALLNTTAHADRPDRSAMRLEQIAAVERGELAELLKTSLKPLYLASRHRGNTPLLEAILRMGLDLGPDVFRRQSLALKSRRDSWDVLGSIICPTLVLCGREDQLCPVQVHVEMANSVPHADLLVLSETGHLSCMEEPAAVTWGLQRLLGRPS